jgi:large subunit ribosomal protein L9
MEVILHKGVGRLGKLGEVVAVADGYARNYLIPRGIAEEATSANLKSWQTKKKKLEAAEAVEHKSTAELAGKLAGVELSVTEKAGDEGQLFGSVGSARIVSALKEAGYDVDETAVILAAPIKQSGEHEIELKLGEAPYPKIKLTIEGE